ncbi:hypothetical protein D210916BOD24_04100 [Alteromonas sp. D210916BOD_24]|uniref:hypothetical protein n=1 Tax=Alteromonas sp. D210916BOD_24 TaxID=3157618 RepID=UPI00399CFB01
MKTLTLLTTTYFTLSLALSSQALAADINGEISSAASSANSPASAFVEHSALTLLQQQWAHINYELDDKEKEDAFIALINKAKGFVKASPDNAELLIWQGIIQSSTAGAKGGLRALDYAKAARKSFEHAMRIDENALSGSAMTSLGVLYHKLPGWPISFGSDKKAEKLLKHALEINPQGIDPNYFYAEFLYDNGEYEQALLYTHKARQAPSRPERPVADLGRRQEIALLEAKIAQKK